MWYTCTGQSSQPSHPLTHPHSIMITQNRTLPFILSVLYEECMRKRNQTENSNQTTGRSPSSDDTDFGAVMYITTVLVFYSAGIVVMIIKYLKTEKREMEEEAALDNFFKHMPDHQRQKENHVNKVAIQAFHTLTTAAAYDSSSIVGAMDDDLIHPPQTLLVSDV